MGNDGRSVRRLLRHSRRFGFGFPVICDEGSYRIVQGLDLSDEFSQNRIAATLAELEEERSAIQDLLKTRPILKPNFRRPLLAALFRYINAQIFQF